MPDFSNPARRTTAQRLARSTPFQVDEEKEALLRLRDERPEEFSKLPPAALIGVGLYESGRDRHQEITGGTAA